MSQRRLWIIKVGSQLIVEGGPLLLRSWIEDVAFLKQNHGIDIIWVTSGAIASARKRIAKNWQSLPEKQALSAIGQPMLMEQYNLALQAHGLMGAQVLLSYGDFKNKKNRTNLRNTLKKLLDWKVLPILNENDAVATDEIQFGDNDFLSSLVAVEMQADRLIILTNVDGLFDQNPDKNPNARLIQHIPRLTIKHLNAIDAKAKSAHGRGGMYSKLRAALHAQKHKVPTTILRGDQNHALLKLLDPQAIATHVGPILKNKKKVSNKK